MVAEVWKQDYESSESHQYCFHYSHIQFYLSEAIFQTRWYIWQVLKLISLWTKHELHNFLR